MNDKPTIEEALKQKISSPWKLTDCSGPPVWKVIRKRPEDLTAELYQRLLAYKSKDGEIRELFHASCLEWAGLKQGKGIVSPGNRHAITRTMDLPKVPIFPESVHVPEPAEVEQFFAPDPSTEPTLIELANELVEAIKRRDTAQEEIDIFINEIQRIATGGNTK